MFSTITSSLFLAIEIQHHGISSSTPLLALLVSCTLRSLRELLPPLFGHVASLQLSLVLGRVTSLLSYSSPLPHGGLLLSRASSLVKGSVAVAGYRRSSGSGGPVAWYCTPSWHHRWVRWAHRKVVTLLRSPSLALLGLILSCPVFRSRGSVTASLAPALWPWPWPLSPSRLRPCGLPRSLPPHVFPLALRPGPHWPRRLVFV